MLADDRPEPDPAPEKAGGDDSVGGEQTVLSPELRQRLNSEPDKVLADAFLEYRTSFRYLVLFRMDRRLSKRIDPDDVLQEAFLSAKSRLPHFLAARKHTLFAWLRMIVVQTLCDVHRRHLTAERRSAGREVQLGSSSVRYPQTTSLSLAGKLAADQPTPSGVVMREESVALLERLIATLSEQDQEVIAMRHFENLGNQQVAEVLMISSTAASNRYVRALQRLRDVLERAGLGMAS
ncbi:sigma-70 family RNA polymerase sigma factor [Roseiconus nitratireducens]|uniref:Sigma-70 family RNA polymerase sigma factor n=1 Tax=Roseiconus nitratireducens TaxID=2605748 RepID=A0A5M6DH52_9BACT|nr:sigma-70 family RNA polymerase sigma factor [Roseiconus nitratireducens]KAA5546874.1 sigma-70 family RNA polymerase sigma factor [Roseiconus nitratireducens]